MVGVCRRQEFAQEDIFESVGNLCALVDGLYASDASGNWKKVRRCLDAAKTGSSRSLENCLAGNTEALGGGLGSCPALLSHPPAVGAGAGALVFGVA